LRLELAAIGDSIAINILLLTEQRLRNRKFLDS
jgi:hypothetical protein